MDDNQYNEDAHTIYNLQEECERLNHRIVELTTDLHELKLDAKRYRFICEVLAQRVSPHMDGTYQYRLKNPYGRGKSLDEVIDLQLMG